MRGRLCSSGIGGGGGDSLRARTMAIDSWREESLSVEGLCLCSFRTGECRALEISPLTRRVKFVRLEAWLEVVDEDQRLRLRKPKLGLRPPPLVDREWAPGAGEPCSGAGS